MTKVDIFRTDFQIHPGYVAVAQELACPSLPTDCNLGRDTAL